MPLKFSRRSEWPFSGSTRQQVNLTLTATPPGGPLQSTSLSAALPKMGQLATQVLEFRDQNNGSSQVGDVTLAHSDGPP